MSGAPFRRGFYAILDLHVLGGRDPLVMAARLLEGGAVALQLRAKTSDPEARASLGPLSPLACALRDLCLSGGVPFIVNDDLDLAAACEAEGVHLGQRDGEPDEARGRLGPGALIGRSTHSLAEVATASREPVSYLGFGPIFATRTKTDADPVQGLSILSQACRATSLPVVAIGGLSPEHGESLARAGAWAAAAIGSVLNAPDPAAAVRAFGDALGKG